MTRSWQASCDIAISSSQARPNPNHYPSGPSQLTQPFLRGMAQCPLSRITHRVPRSTILRLVQPRTNPTTLDCRYRKHERATLLWLRGQMGYGLVSLHRHVARHGDPTRRHAYHLGLMISHGTLQLSRKKVVFATSGMHPNLSIQYPFTPWWSMIMAPSPLGARVQTQRIFSSHRLYVFSKPLCRYFFPIYNR